MHIHTFFFLVHVVAENVFQLYRALETMFVLVNAISNFNKVVTQVFSVHGSYIIKVSYTLCPGFGWDRVNFLISS